MLKAKNRNVTHATVHCGRALCVHYIYSCIGRLIIGWFAFSSEVKRDVTLYTVCVKGILIKKGN